MRRLTSSVFGLVLVALLAAVGLALPAAAVLAQSGTPVPAPTQAPAEPTQAPPAPTEAAAPAPTEAPAAPAPTEAPARPATTDVVTLVGWYFNAPDGAFLDIVPLQVAGNGVAGRADNAKSIGKADFPDGDLPTITWGDTTFTGYLRWEGDTAERWTWTNDTEGVRPATLVIQVEGKGGTYNGYFGTATFVSRDPEVGGPLVIALRPPGSATAEPTAAPEAAPADAAAQEAPTEAPPADVAPPADAGQEAPVETAVP